MVVEAPDRGVVTGGGAHQEVGVGDGGQVAQYLRQLAGSELAGSAGAVAELGQPAGSGWGSHAWKSMYPAPARIRRRAVGTELGMGDGRVGEWAVERLGGSAAAFHARELPEAPVRTISVLEVDRRALVLGSTQADEAADPLALARAETELVRRRSGGGAVLLVPGEALWVDVVIPRSDPLWDDDVGRATHWLGSTWAGALGELGLHATVHTGAMLATRWSPLVCFAGLGPGEVSVSGRKVVGISQRRTRFGVRFQCVALQRWDPVAIVQLLDLETAARAAATADLTGAASGLGRPGSIVADAFLDQLLRHWW